MDIHYRMDTHYRLVATSPCPVGLAQIALAPNGDAYVTSSGDMGGIGVIERATYAMSLMNGAYSGAARGIAVAPDTGYVYVSPSLGDCVARFIPNEGWARADIQIDGEHVDGKLGNLAVPRLGTELYVLVHVGYRASMLYVIDRATHIVANRIPINHNTGFGRRLEVTPDGSQIYIGIEDRNALAVVNRTTNAVETIPIGPPLGPLLGMTVSPDGARLYIGGHSRVDVLNTATNLVQDTIRVDDVAVPTNIAVSPNLPHLYVVPYGGKSLIIINTDTHAVEGAISFWGDGSAGHSFQQIAVTPDGALLYILRFEAKNSVTFIETPLQYLDVKVTAGSAPEWLVSRYAVQCTYQTPNGVRSCGNAVFDHNGGVVEGLVSDEGGSFPATVLVTVTIDFAPDTGLQGLVKHFSPAVTDTGVSFLYEPRQVLQKTDLIFDLRPTPLTTDYLVIRWSHNMGGGTVASGNKYLSGDELRQQPLAQCSIMFALGPVSDDNLRLEIVGRYQDQELPRFQQTFQLSDGAIVLRAQRASPDTDYGLVVV